MTKSVRASVLTGVLASVSVIGAVVLTADQRTLGPAGGGIAVDFIAVGANGQPVADLKPADVAIKINGKARTVSALEFMKADAGGGGAAAATALPAPFFVNGGSSTATGRSIIIVVDNESLRVGTERSIRESLDVIFNGLGPNDHVALSVAPRDTVGLGLGAGLPAVRAAAAKVSGIRPANVSSSDAACRSRDSLLLLRNLMERAASGDTPTTILYISSGLVLPSNVTRNTSSSVQCEVTMENYQSLGSAGVTQRVNLYVAQGDDTISGRDDGLENLAGVTGAGAVLRAQGQGLARVLNETSGYYFATIAPDPADKPGIVQKLEVKVNREGVTTRARADVALKGRGAAMAAGGKATPKEMVATMAPFSDLPLRGTAVVTRGAGGKLNVLTITEPVEAGVKLSAASAVIIAPGAAKAAFALSADDKQLAGRPLLLSLAADPGKYRVRIAATDTNGRAGAVDLEVDANLTAAGPLQIGQMMLLAPRGENFAPQLQFSDEAEIAVVFELYGPLTTLKMGAKVDVASSIDGKSLVEGVVGGAGTNEPDKFALNAKIPLGKLPPGDYVIRAIVGAEGHPEGRVLKTVRKVAK